MKHMRLIFLLVVIPVILDGCAGKNNGADKLAGDFKADKAYLGRYAGAYTVETEGVPPSSAREAYALNSDGSARWMLIVSKGARGWEVQKERKGTWKADKSLISITTQGADGEVSELYRLWYDSFVSMTNSKRYLKKSE